MSPNEDYKIRQILVEMILLESFKNSRANLLLSPNHLPFSHFLGAVT